MRIHSVILLVVLWASACATPSVSTDAPSSLAGTAQADASIDAPSGLPPQTLEPNECGLFLWSKTDTSRFVFFMKAGAQDGLVLLEDTPTRITKTGESGDLFGQFFTDLRFVTASGAQIALSYEPGEPLSGGARISNGLIQFKNAEDWRITLPVLGVRVCQRANPETLGVPAKSGQP